MPYSHLTLPDREVSYKMLLDEKSHDQIGRALGQHKSTVSRELARHRVDGHYDPLAAQKNADHRRANSKVFKMEHPPLREYVEARLYRYWSPDQIAGRLPIDHPRNPRMRISHETLYQWIAADRDGFRGDLHTRLRQAHRKRRRRRGTLDNRGRIVDRVGIEHRPKIVDGRSRLGDWEADTVNGHGHPGCLATHVDRKSRYTVLAHMKNRRAATFNQRSIAAFARHGRRHGPLPCQTMTADNGKEFAAFKALQKALGLDVYFADPYHACQRATNENTNGLIRQFFPKKTDFSRITYNEVLRVEDLLNHRPRKCLGYRTPFEVLHNKAAPVALQT
jgi:IS30 family transposase